MRSSCDSTGIVWFCFGGGSALSSSITVHSATFSGLSGSAACCVICNLWERKSPITKKYVAQTSASRQKAAAAVAAGRGNGYRHVVFTRTFEASSRRSKRWTLLLNRVLQSKMGKSLQRERRCVTMIVRSSGLSSGKGRDGRHCNGINQQSLSTAVSKKLVPPATNGFYGVAR